MQKLLNPALFGNLNSEANRFVLGSFVLQFDQTFVIGLFTRMTFLAEVLEIINSEKLSELLNAATKYA